MLNRNDDQNEAKKMVLFCIAAASIVLLLFLVVLYTHDSKNYSNHVVKKQADSQAEEPEIEVGKSNIVSSDLDFWDMFDEEKTSLADEENEESLAEKSEKSKEYSKQLAEKRASSSSSSKKNSGEDSMNSAKEKEKDEMDDGRHIKVIGSDGKPAWYEILEDVKKNDYSFEKNLLYDNGLLKYSSSDTDCLLGTDISNYQGNIDFAKVKAAGIDYVMIKVGARGYESGQINIDDRFVEYAGGATSAGLQIGVFISSQAITDVEAVEEANFAVAAANNYNVKYPIVIDLTQVTSEKSRTDKLTSSERTAIVNKFCETVKFYGKTPAVRASRDYLISKLDLEKLSGCDIWLKDEAVLPDSIKMEKTDDDEEDSSSSSSSSGSLKSKYSKSSSSTQNEEEQEQEYEYIGTDYPYCFSMWQYTEKGTINGIDGSVNMDMSFVNYAER